MNTASAAFTAGASSVVNFSRPAFDVACDQVVEPRLVDRHLAALERGDLACVLVDAGDLVAEVGKAGPGNEADIAGADHGNAHNPTLNPTL